MDLPYSVIRGEQVAIKVIVFNYEDKEKEVAILNEICLSFSFFDKCEIADRL